ncbi:hypothetical protein ECEH2086_04195 [Escherichia coli O145:H28]|nr:hypothetical protein ECEH2086_04195 [Escherichia coli O145:H28]
MAGGAAVALGIGDARRDAVGRFAQRTDRRGRHGNTPVAGGVGGGAVVLSVQRDGDRRARWLIAGARKRQIRSFFRRVDHIIARDGVDANHWRAEADGHGAAGVVAVARPIADAGGDGLCAATECRNIRCRNANAPVTGGIQRGGVGFAVEHNAHHIARFPARAGAGNHQRLGVFGVIDDVIARHGIYGKNRRGGVYRQIMAGAAGVARFVVDRGADGVIACAQRAQG